jgi:hypothetical protein
VLVETALRRLLGSTRARDGRRLAFSRSRLMWSPPERQLLRLPLWSVRGALALWIPTDLRRVASPRPLMRR